jgi:hypothetical protein
VFPVVFLMALVLRQGERPRLLCLLVLWVRMLWLMVVWCMELHVELHLLLRLLDLGRTRRYWLIYCGTYQLFFLTMAPLVCSLMWTNRPPQGAC